MAWISSSSREYLLNAVSIHLWSASLKAARCETVSNLEMMSNALREVLMSVNTACKKKKVLLLYHNCVILAYIYTYPCTSDNIIILYIPYTKTDGEILH